MALAIEQESIEIFDGEIEVDESYFGGTRKGKRGRGCEFAVDWQLGIELWCSPAGYAK